MHSIEIVQVRLFDVSDGELVIDAFNQIPQKPPSSRVTLYQSAQVTNDWSICFLKSNADDNELKSPEAICLGESLRQVGLVHHALWLLVPMGHDESQGQFGFKKEPLRRKTPHFGKAGP